MADCSIRLPRSHPLLHWSILVVAVATLVSCPSARAQPNPSSSIGPGHVAGHTANVDDEPWIDNVHEVAVRPDGKELWATGLETRAVVVADLETPGNPVLAKIKLPWNHSHPHSHIAFSPDGRMAYLTNTLDWEVEVGSGINRSIGQVIAIDTASKTIVATIPVEWPLSPTASLVVSPDGKLLYFTAADYPAGRRGIARLELATQKVTGFLDLPGANFVDRSPDGARLYVTQGGAEGQPAAGSRPNVLSVVDASGFRAVASIPVGDYPHRIAVTPDGGKAYVANRISNDVTVVDLVAMKPAATIPVGPDPGEIAVTPDGRKAYVGVTNLTGHAAAYGPGMDVDVIDALTDARVRSIRLNGLEPQSVAVAPDGRTVYASDGGANGLKPARVHVIDAEADVLQGQIVLRDAAVYTPTAIDVTPDGARIFVVAEGKGSLLVVDRASRGVLASLEVAPRAVKLSRDGKRAYVYCPKYPGDGRGRLLLLDVDSLEVLDSVDLGVITAQRFGDQVAYRIVLDSQERTAYLAGGDGDEVLVVDLEARELSARIRIGDENNRRIVSARGLAISPDDGKLFASSAVARTVSVIDTATRTIVATLDVGNLPSELKLSADGGRLYVLQQQQPEMIRIIDTTTYKTVATVNFPTSAALDFVLSGGGRYAYVAHYDPNWVLVYDLDDTGFYTGARAIIKTGIDPFNMAATADKRFIYVTNLTSDTVSVIDTRTNTVADDIPLNTGPEQAPVGG